MIKGIPCYKDNGKLWDKEDRRVVFGDCAPKGKVSMAVYTPIGHLVVLIDPNDIYHALKGEEE